MDAFGLGQAGLGEVAARFRVGLGLRVQGWIVAALGLV